MDIKLNPLWFRRSYWRLFLAGLCFSLILSILHHPLAVQSATINQAKITEILDSSQVYINGNQARVKAIARKGQRVSTRNARAQLSFNTGAVGRLAHNSVLTVGQCAHLQRGTLLVNGSANGCTNSTIAGVRGTTYILSVDETGQEEIQVLEGEVVLSQRVNPGIEEDKVIRGLGKKASFVKASQLAVYHPLRRKETLPTSYSLLPTPCSLTPKECFSKAISSSIEDELIAQEEESMPQPVTLNAGEKVKIRPNGEVGQVQSLTANEFEQLLIGELFDDFTAELPGIDKIKESFQGLFPGISFPLPLPDIPSIPLPDIPSIPQIPQFP